MSFNEKQYNNTGYMIKHSEEIVKSYVTRKGKNQDLPISLRVVRKRKKQRLY